MTTKKNELYITRCMLLGCTFKFDNYGHPEREHVRKYHECIGPVGDGTERNGLSFRGVGFGTDQGQAAYDYLRRYHPDLL